MICIIAPNLAWYSSFIRIMLHYSLLTNVSSSAMFLKASWGSLTNVFIASTTPSTLTPNCLIINTWSMVIFSPQIIVLMRPSSLDSQVCKNSSNKCGHGIVQWIINKPPKLAHSIHCHYLNPIRIHCSILWISFASESVRFWIILAGELPSTYSFLLHLIMNLDRTLVGTTSMSKESISMSKNPPLIDVDKKIANCSTSIGCSTSSSTSIVFFSACSSSSKSLIIMNVGIGGE